MDKKREYHNLNKFQTITIEFEDSMTDPTSILQFGSLRENFP